ncbi:Drug/metabolite transporter [Globisporangium polare]
MTATPTGAGGAAASDDGGSDAAGGAISARASRRTLSAVHEHELSDALLPPNHRNNYKPSKHKLDLRLTIQMPSLAHSGHTIDVAESEGESEDLDWVSSDYNHGDSELESSTKSHESMTVLSDGGVIIREDLPYIVGPSSSARRKKKKKPSHTSHDPHSNNITNDLRAPLDQKAHDAGAGFTETHVTLFNRKHAGLLFSLACASMLTSCLKRGVLPLMQNEMAMEQYQVDATTILLMLPWCCGLLVGFVSDLFPIRGSHRKSYMMIGWAITVLGLFAMVLLNNSYKGKLKNNSSYGSEKRTQIVGGYVALLGVACFGGISSVIVGEIYIVALSQREVLKKRGYALGTYLLTQFFFEGVGQAATDTVVFHAVKGGKLSPIYSLQDVLTFLVCYSMIPIPMLYFFFNDKLESTGGRIGECELLEDDDDDYLYDNDEKSTRTRVVTKVKRHWLRLWAALQQKATWNVICFLCTFIFFTEFTLNYPYAVLDKWAGVTSKITSTSKIFAEAMYFLSALVWIVFFLNRNWNNFVVVSFLGVFVFPSMAYSLVCALGSYWKIGLYMFMGSFRGFVRGIAIILEVAMTVEIAPRGGEGALLGTIVSMATIMRLISETFSNSIGWLFGTQFLSQDTGTATKGDEPLLVATALILCFTIRLLALLGVLFLPSQKVALLRLRFVGGRKPRRAWATLAILVVSILTAAIVNSLIITPETMCLPAFGGKGCSK